jgi:hypothetical protein
LFLHLLQLVQLWAILSFWHERLHWLPVVPASVAARNVTRGKRKKTFLAADHRGVVYEAGCASLAMARLRAGLDPPVLLLPPKKFKVAGGLTAHE